MSKKKKKTEIATVNINVTQVARAILALDQIVTDCKVYCRGKNVVFLKT